MGQEYPHWPGGEGYEVVTSKGNAIIVVDEKSKTVFINSVGLNSNTEKFGGGSQVYQMVQTFAHHNGLTFVPDDNVSPIAQKRRLSQLVSSALRHGTTDHLNGLATFKDGATGEIKTEIPGWRSGDHEHNLALLLRAEQDYVLHEADAHGIDISHLTHDPETDTIINGHTGPPITKGTLQSLVDRFQPGSSGVGTATLLRAIVTRSALHGSGPGQRFRPLHTVSGEQRGRAPDGQSDERLVSVARDLYYSRPSQGAGGVSPRRLGDSLSQRSGGLATALTEAVGHLNRRVPGFVSERTQVFATVEDLLHSPYAQGRSFTPEQQAQLESAEGFHDSAQGGRSVIIASNIVLRPGETPQTALIRVLLHERVGHEGLYTLLGKDQSFQKRWKRLSQQIPQEELNLIASEDAYAHLATDRNALTQEWFARQAEKGGIESLQKQPLLRELWDTLKTSLLDLYRHLGLPYPQGKAFDHDLQTLLHQARKAVLKSQGESTTARSQQTNDLSFSKSQNDTNTSKSSTLLNAAFIETERRDFIARSGKRPQFTDSDQQRVYEAFFNRVSSNVPEMVTEYLARNGNRVDADLAREFEPAYAANREGRQRYAASTGHIANTLTRKVYETLLDRTKPGTVLFNAGGSGSGKSSTLRDSEAKSMAIIYDTMMADSKRGIKLIDQALAKGHKIIISYIHQPLHLAVGNTIKRALDPSDGRIVEAVVTAKTHAASQKAIFELYEHYKNDSRVTIRVVNNEQFQNKPTSLDYLKTQVYNESQMELETRAIDAAKDYFSKHQTDPNLTREIVDRILRQSR